MPDDEQPFKELPFAYVAFVNAHPLYQRLLLTLIESHRRWSQYPLIIYTVQCEYQYRQHPSCQYPLLHFLPLTVELPCIYYFKPYIIIDALLKGLRAGYYVEADDLLTPYADRLLVGHAAGLSRYPISPIHSHEPKIPPAFMANLGVSVKTQHYVHAHVLFVASNLGFCQEWLLACLRSNGANWDETVLNCLFWKHGLKDHHLPLIDPFFHRFYDRPERRKQVSNYDACKDPVFAQRMLKDMVEYYEHGLEPAIPSVLP